ncbi:MAG: acyl-CoA/acyl-ACP dehydrogenase [Nitrospinaceae bacterium]|jgi:alkylation response protein AidB-like acyl-CoA dehydrogenase|nr:acyl-CoA/acyl-ACP dehydrogenase [Nitrospinaceae bacterium]MBT3822379.1 acyl-CoA/acyl-ACP dehydrogenase [Nitrospinaceae bacterium]MBT4094152.1 acyl-CoA/acyl-ACP dehydrogenase [Nitrospinaceae bacterium]MBT4430705.1 acyl-CoA/acyl-ACP dehydrogenase [Nitrospinaceae bacterium]MBT5369311.1 acyl-CoA/acyl-ACP dehydrogenase [Nitrospinaceae bacterium]
MDFSTNPKYGDLIKRSITISKDILAPRAEVVDQENKFPRANFNDMAQEGFMSLTLPEPLGGRDLYADPEAYSMILYELGKGCTTTAMLFHMHSSIVHVLTCLLGSAEQSERYARAVLDGKIFASYASETTSSLHGKMVMDTHAKNTDDGYIINGKKYFCSMAGEADFYVLWCQLGDEELARSLYLFVTPAGAPGMKIDKGWDSFSMRGTMSASMSFEDVKIAPNDRVGNAGDPIRPDVLPKFGFGYSAVYLGAGGGAFEWVVDYAKKRKLQPDNVPIATYPPISRQIGEMKIALDAALLMVRRAGWLIGANGAEAAYGAINEAKFTSAETAAMITEKAIKIAGGSGLMRHFPLQRFHRDARAGMIMPPSTEKCLELAGITAIKGKAGALMT